MSFEQKVKDAIRTVPNFPKDGINFMDITTLLNNGKLLDEVISHFYERYKDEKIDFVAGIESRGFILGTPLAIKLGVGFVPIRKVGKLPHETFQVSYDLEYGKDTLEIHKDAFHNKNANVLLVDDLLATGGTAKAAIELIEKSGANVVEALFLINLTFLNGEEKLNKKSYSLIRE
jgi:adenine phosphoribosyltransferase